MNILFVQESDWLQKGPHQQHQLADRLSLRGHRIQVIDFEIGWRDKQNQGLYSKRQVFNDVWKVWSTATVTVIRPGIVRLPWLDYVSLIFTHGKEIKRQIKEFAPEVIIGFGILNSYLAARTANQNSIPFIYYWIDVLHRLIPFRPFWLVGRIMETKTLRQANRVLVINNKLKDYVIKLGALPARTQVLGADIDVERFNPTGAADRVRKQYGLKEDDIVLFFMGWLYHFSGLKEIAMELLKNKSKLKLLIVGEGDAYKELQQIQQKYNLQDRLILTGKRPYREIPQCHPQLYLVGASPKAFAHYRHW